MKDDYIYAVARIRSRELSLLTQQDLNQLIACKSYDECLRVLSDKGWGDKSNISAEALLTEESEKTWSLIRELSHDLSPFSVLLLPIDYNNLKAAIKMTVTSALPHNVFLKGGSISPDFILKAAQNSDFSVLPPSMAHAAESAYRTFLETQDGQLCDVILDRACLLEIEEYGSKSDNSLLKEYAEMTVAISNIKIALRACKTKKNRAFLSAALVPCATLDVSSLALAAGKDLDSVFSYLASTEYAQASERLKESYSAFEAWCDNTIMDLMKSQKYNAFTVGPLFAYVIARQREISVVRIILAGKLNELDDSVIRERLRDLYV